MSDFHFFIDPDLMQQQTAQQAYGLMTPDQGFDRYRVISLHSALSSTFAYSMLGGRVAIQAMTLDLQDIPLHPSYQSLPELVSVIIKPSGIANSTVRIPQIKYIIYKGILKESIFNSNNEIPADSGLNSNALTRKIFDDRVRFNNAVNTTGLADGSTVGFDKTETSLNFENDKPIDHLFYGPLELSWIIKPGESIGQFYPGQFGIEIIFESPRYNPVLEVCRRMDHIIKVAELPLTPSPTPDAIFIHRTLKEEILYYVDPCAIIGSLFTENIYKIDNPTTEEFISLSGNDIYEQIFLGTFSDATADDANFFNRNKIYLDIRNDHNHSINYYGDYTDSISLDIGNGSIPYDYYRDLWPVLTLDGTRDNFGSINTFKSDLTLRLPKGNNVFPLVFVSKGYTGINSTFSEQLNEKLFLDSITPGGSELETQPFEINTHNYFPNQSSNTKLCCNYIRLRYYKRILPASPTGYFPRGTDTFDNIFLPLQMDLTLPQSSQINSRVYHEEVIVPLTSLAPDYFLASIGLAFDNDNCTYFLFASNRKSDYKAISGDARTFTLVSESDNINTSFIRLVDKRAVRNPATQTLLETGERQFGAPYNTFDVIKFSSTAPSSSEFDAIPLNTIFFAIILPLSNLNTLKSLAQNSFSNGYDVYLGIVNRNSLGLLDLQNRTYSSIELVTRGYLESSGIITMPNDQGSASNTSNLTAFSFSDGLIYKTHDAAIPIDETEEECECQSQMSNEELGYLKVFIDELYHAGYVKTPPHLPSKLMYDNLHLSNVATSDPDKLWVEDDSGNFTLHMPNDLTILPVGYLGEMCMVFTIWLWTRQMELINGSTTETMKDDNLQPCFYRKIKKFILSPDPDGLGFKFQAGADELEARQTLNNFLMGPNTQTNFIIDYYIAGFGLEPVSGSNVHKANAKKVKENITHDPVITDRDDAEEAAVEHLNRLNQFVTGELEKKARCLFNVFLPGEEPPILKMIGAGDGSDTLSIMDYVNFGVFYFNYTFILNNKRADILRNNAMPANTFTTFGGGATSVFHMSTYGISVTPSTPQEDANPNFNNIVEVQFTLDGVNYSSFFLSKRQDLNGTDRSILTPIGFDPRNPNNDRTILNPIPDTSDPSGNTWILVNPVTNDTIGIYNKTLQDLRIVNTQSRIAVSILVKAFVQGGEADQMAIAVNLVKIPGHNADVHVYGEYDDDRFELLDTYKFNSLLISFSDDQFVHDVVLALARNATITYDLHGNFVGKYEGPPLAPFSEVIPDSLYDIFGSPRTLETSSTQAGYDKLRYSFAKIQLNGDRVHFHIEAYASPLRSRLDKRYIGGTSSDDYRGNNAFNVGRKSFIDGQSQFGATPTLMDGANPLRSYNQLLTALRCFGLLEAIFYRLRKKAREMSPAVSVNPEINNSEYTAIVTRLNNLLTVDTTDPSLRVRTFGSNLISPENYQYLKWYKTSTENQLYDGDGY